MRETITCKDSKEAMKLFDALTVILKEQYLTGEIGISGRRVTFNARGRKESAE